MSNPQDPNQWSQQGWQQPHDKTQIAPQYGGQPPYTPGGDPNQGAAQQWPGQQQGQWPGQQPQGQSPQAPWPGAQQGQWPGQQQYGQDQFGGQQQFGAQPYGPQFGQQPAPGGAPKKSKTGLIVGIAAAAIIAIVVIALIIAFATGLIGGKKFDNGKVNEGVTKVLKETYNEGDTTNVSCKTDGVKVKAGESFTCDATVGGKQKKVQVTVVDDEGKYRVGAPS
ncbi:hypothetical protein GCM10027289_04390 [Tsukamurella serpentis]